MTRPGTATTPKTQCQLGTIFSSATATTDPKPRPTSGAAICWTPASEQWTSQVLTIFGSRNMPKATQERVQAALLETARAPQVTEAMLANDSLPEAMASTQAEKVLEATAKTWAAVAKEIDLKAE